MFIHCLAFIDWEIIWVQWKNPKPTSAKKSPFFVALLVSFWDLLVLHQSFSRKASIDFGRAWNSLSFCILAAFLAFMCWKVIRAWHRHASWQTLATGTVFVICFAWVSKVHDGREFQALLEYIITYSKSYPYIDNKVEITREMSRKIQFLKIFWTC